MCARDIEPMRYSKHVMECCQELLDHLQYPSDTAAVHLVRLHGVAGKISQNLDSEEWDQPLGFSSAPIGACVKAIESELLKVKESPATGLDGYGEFRHSEVYKTDWSTVLSIHYYAVEAFLYEIALSDTIEDERYGSYSLARLGMLYACLNSVRLLFDQVHAISSSEWYDTPYTTWALVRHALVVLSRLSLCKADGWDPESNCSIVDFSTLIDALALKFEVEQNVLQRAPPSDTSDGVF